MTIAIFREPRYLGYEIVKSKRELFAEADMAENKRVDREWARWDGTPEEANRILAAQSERVDRIKERLNCPLAYATDPNELPDNLKHRAL